MANIASQATVTAYNGGTFSYSYPAYIVDGDKTTWAYKTLGNSIGGVILTFPSNVFVSTICLYNPANTATDFLGLRVYVDNVLVKTTDATIPYGQSLSLDINATGKVLKFTNGFSSGEQKISEIEVFGNVVATVPKNQAMSCGT